MIFRHSGEPKKSVFSRVFGSSRKFCAERGDGDPKLARYHLRYTSWVAVLRLKYYNILPRFCQELLRVKFPEKAGFYRYFLRSNSHGSL